MLEAMCNKGLYDMCFLHTPQPPIVYVKGQKVFKEKWKWCDFFQPGDQYTIWDSSIVKKILRGGPVNPLRKSAAFMSINSQRLGSAFVRERYGGDLDRAMESCGAFKEFVRQFDEYFAEKRTKFMEEMLNQIIQQEKTDGITHRKTRVAGNQGGVANLLKVLTKTMTEQGSSIRSIAKVQYEVCRQAGIYIPDEFITDVCVALTIDPNCSVVADGK